MMSRGRDRERRGGGGEEREWSESFSSKDQEKVRERERGGGWTKVREKEKGLKQSARSRQRVGGAGIGPGRGTTHVLIMTYLIHTSLFPASPQIETQQRNSPTLESKEDRCHAKPSTGTHHTFREDKCDRNSSNDRWVVIEVSYQILTNQRLLVLNCYSTNEQPDTNDQRKLCVPVDKNFGDTTLILLSDTLCDAVNKLPVHQSHLLLLQGNSRVVMGDRRRPHWRNRGRRMATPAAGESARTDRLANDSLGGEFRKGDINLNIFSGCLLGVCSILVLRKKCKSKGLPFRIVPELI